MKICLAGTCILTNCKEFISLSKYNLESFYYFKDWQLPYLKSSKLFLLDSGAFTFMNSNKKADFNEYLDRYIKFINENDIEHFFELDIDSVVGLKKVEKMREKLEKETHKRCIPVWHKNRGVAKFKELCDGYDYIAIGGIVTKEIKKTEYSDMAKLVKYANSKGVKVHGLGFTQLEYLDKIPFYSVDSSSWSNGGQYGFAVQFKNRKLKRIVSNYRINVQKMHEHNFKEWIKIQKYMEEI